MLSKIEKEIISEYISKIENTDIQKKYRALICPFGLIAVGKSTVVSPISTKLNIPRISRDELRKLLKDSNLNYENVHKMFYAIAKHFLRSGYGLILDSDNIRNIDQIEKFKKEFYLEVISIHIVAPEKYILNKIRSFEGESWLTDGDQEKLVDNYFRKKPMHKNIVEKINFDYTIDTSSKNLNDQIEKLVKNIESKILKL